jgi:hypothetical protein
MEPTPTADKVSPPDVGDVFARGTRGDTAVLPALRKAFADHPELVSLVGDIARHAEDTLLTLVAGENLTAKHAFRLKLAEVREKLLAGTSSELERLLVERVVLCWLEVNYGDIDMANRLLQNAGASQATLAAQKRRELAERRLGAAVKALATVQRLLRPAASPLAIARNTHRDASVLQPHRKHDVPGERCNPLAG